MNYSPFAVLSISPFTSLLLESAVKGCLLLMLAFALSPGLRRLSAARRHGVWLGVVCGLLALPGLSCLLPGLSCLPSWCRAPAGAVRAAST